ncbi:ribonuclease H-like domain-containing protein [Tanacetum coccineum]
MIYGLWKMEHYLAILTIYYGRWGLYKMEWSCINHYRLHKDQSKVLHPRTTEENCSQRKRVEKARIHLLMALPEDHSCLKKFHKRTDAKSCGCLNLRFGGKTNQEDARKYILKQTSLKDSLFPTQKGLHKGYDSTAYCVPNPSGQNSKYEQTSSYSLLANQSSCPQLDHEDLEQIDEYDLEEMDLKWQTGHFARECRIKGNQDNRRRDAWNSGNKDGSRTGKKEDSKALVTIDGEGVDWTNHSEEDEDYALMACNSSESDTEVTSCSNKCKESYANLKKLYDAQREQLSDASIEIKAYSQGLKKVEAQLVAHQQGQLWYEQKIKFMKIDLDDKTDVLTYHKKLLAEAQKEKEDLKAKVEKWHNSSKNLSKLLNTQMSANDKFRLGYGDHRYDGILSYENETQPSESESQSSEFDTCESNISTEPSELVSEPVVNESNVECQPKVWSDAPIIEEYKSDSEDEYVSIPTKQQETPSFANQQVKTPRETVKNQFTHSQKPKVDKKELGYGFTVRACFVCGSLNHLIRDCDFHEKRMARKAELNNKLSRNSGPREIRPIWNNVQRINKQKQFVPAALVLLGEKGKLLLSPQQVVIGDHKDTTGTISPNTMVDPVLEIDYPHRALKNKGIVDSGCSIHMTGNKAYLAEFKTLMVARCFWRY